MGMKVTTTSPFLLLALASILLQHFTLSKDCKTGFLNYEVNQLFLHCNKKPTLCFTLLLKVLPLSW